MVSDSSEANSTITTSFNTFATVLITNIAIAGAIFIAFGILRSFKKFRYFFAPQYYEQRGTTDSLPPPGTGLFSWVPIVLRFKEEDIFQIRGLDAVIYLKLIKYLAILFLFFAPFGLGVLLPLDATADGLKDQSQLAKLSIANVGKHSNKLWGHGVFTVFCTVLTLYCLHLFYKQYTALRVKWMKMDVARNYTIMFTGLPQDTLRQIYPTELFNQYFPGEVVDAQVGVDAHGLRKLVKKWEKNDEKLRFARAALEERGTRTTKRTTPLFGTKMDAITYYQQKLVELGRQIDAKRAELIANTEISHVGFVTFRSIGLANQNAQLLMDRNAIKLHAHPAPEPTDIYWEELELPRLYRAYATPIAYLIVALLVILWGALTVFVQGIVNLQNLARINGFGWLNTVLNWNPVVTGLITGYLPALVLVILFALLPKVIKLIARSRGVYTHSQLQRSVMKIYFIFLVVNVFFVSLLSGGAITIIHQFVNSSASDVLSILGQALPAQSSFFINYILVYALTSYPMNILQIGSFFISRIKRMRAKSEAECRKAEAPKPWNYEMVIPILLLMFIIGFTYAPIAPFIIPFVLIFYLITYLFGKYLLIYVYNPKYDSGALFWPSCFNRVIASMVLGQLIILGVFIFKTHPAIALIAPLPLITLAFCYVMHKLHDRPSTYLAMNEYPLNTNNGEIYRHLYKDPVLLLDTHKSTQPTSADLPRHHRVGYGSI